MYHKQAQTEKKIFIAKREVFWLKLENMLICEHKYTQEKLYWIEYSNQKDLFLPISPPSLATYDMGKQGKEMKTFRFILL